MKPTVIIALTTVSMLLGGVNLNAAMIDFENLTDGTVVTDQYLDLGVVFEGEGAAGAPVVHDYAGFSLGKVLRGADWNSGLVIRFVEPDAPGTAHPIRRITFSNPMNTETDIISISVYDTADQLIRSAVSYSPEVVTLEFATAEAAVMVLGDEQGTSFVIDDLVFPGIVIPATSSSWGGVKALFR